MKRILSSLAIALLLASAPALADEMEKTRSVTLDYQGGGVNIEHSFGSVTVRSNNSSRVSARLTVRSSDSEFGRQIRLGVSNGPGGITIRTIYPQGNRHENHISWSADMEVSVPDRAPLVVRNRFGSIDAAGLGAPVELINSQGSITVHDSRTTQRIENAFGSVTVIGGGGDLSVQNANGSVQVQHVHGDVTVNDRFGSVSVSDAGHDVAVHNTNGTVDVTDARGSAAISNAFGSTHFADIGGDLAVTSNNGRIDGLRVRGSANISGSFATIEVHDLGPATIANANGSVVAENIRGNLTIDTRFGSVRAENVEGAVDIDDANGSVNASVVRGAARVHTTFASVFLENIGGAVSVENQNGAISVTGLRAPCSAVSLKTSFAPIRVALPPAPAGYDVDARTSFGSIDTDIPITIKHKSENSLTGTIRNGGCRLDLVNANGSITID